MFLPFILKGQNHDPVFGEVFDNVFSNGVSYGDRTGYIIRSTASRYEFHYSGTTMSIRGKQTINSTIWNYLQIFVNDAFYSSFQVNDELYHSVTLPSGDKKVTLLSGLTSRPNNTGDVLGTFITGLNLDTTRYQKIAPTFKSTEYVFLGDSITVGDHATTWVNGYSNLFYKNDKLSTSVLGWGWARLFDFASDSTKISDTVSKITSCFGTATVKKLIIALGTNDYGLSSVSAVNFELYARNLISAIKLADPNIQIWWNEPLYRGSEGALLQSYRELLTSLSVELGTFVKIPCKNCITYPSGYNTDRLHPINCGMVEYYNFDKTYIV
jgi:lysophospholipase L1-like esterase